MNLHEYQAKILLKKFGIPFPPFALANSLEDVDNALLALEAKEIVIKAQVHAGGRGKAGGVKIGNNRQDILTHSKNILGMNIINNQTGKQGLVVRTILLTPRIYYRKEQYVAITIDRKKGKATLLLSPKGGMDIEEISPQYIFTLPLSFSGKVRPYQLVEIVKFMGWKKEGSDLIKNLSKAFMELDATLIEINPLVETDKGELLAIDAKVIIDENALFRHEDIAAFYDPSQSSVAEAAASSHGLSYVSLDGEIGCMVNGAGLAMATMDIIHHYGGRPANFLDVGGGASQDKVAEGFKIIMQDKNVKAILVNIFGGIMNCGTLASGIITAVKELKLSLSLVVRMEGTDVEKGRKLLADSGIDIFIARDLKEAAQKCVEMSK